MATNVRGRANTSGGCKRPDSPYRGKRATVEALTQIVAKGDERAITDSERPHGAPGAVYVADHL